MATLNDIARGVGCSRSTVSRVLNGRETAVAVSPRTRQRILDAARDLNYQPNLFARGMRWKRSSVIGVVIRDFTYPFWDGIVKGISHACTARGYRVILSNVSEEDRGAIASSTLLGHLGVDGLVIAGDVGADEQAIRQILSQCPNTVALSSLSRGEVSTLIPTILSDNVLGVGQLLEYLYSIGHRRIGFVGLDRQGSFRWRFEVYQRFLAERGLPTCDGLVQLATLPERHFPSTDEFIDLGLSMTRRVLESDAPIDALVCACDTLALGALRAAHDRGILVPRDLSIAGFDDAPLARQCIPRLTTIRQQVFEMGRRAADLLIDSVEGKVRWPHDVPFFRTELVVRESTAPRQLD